MGLTSVIMWISHRGLNREAPENTIKAFREAERAGAAGIELDVQITSEGVPVVFHDQTLGRLTQAKGKLTARKLAQLLALRVKQQEGIPTLAEVLEKTSAPLFLDVKDPQGIRSMLKVAEPHKERVTFISFYPNVVARAKAAGFKTGLLTRTGIIGKLIANRLKPNYFFIHSKHATPKIISHFANRGVKVVAWGVENNKHANELMQLGVHAVVADEPFHHVQLKLPSRFGRVKPMEEAHA